MKHSPAVLCQRLVRSVCALLLLGLLANNPVLAQASPAPGEYLNGEGRLLVRPGVHGTKNFDLKTIGQNGSSCHVTGTMTGNKTDIAGGGGASTYGLTLSQQANGTVTVQNGASCSQFCGRDAVLDGDFLKPAAGCHDAERVKTRTLFRQAYAKKDYARAARTLKTLLARCNDVLYALEEGRVRNDLAVTQFHLNDFAGCRKTLEALHDYIDASDDQIKALSPDAPDEAKAYLALAHAGRANRKLCKG